MWAWVQSRSWVIWCLEAVSQMKLAASLVHLCSAKQDLAGCCCCVRLRQMLQDNQLLTKRMPCAGQGGVSSMRLCAEVRQIEGWG